IWCGTRNGQRTVFLQPPTQKSTFIGVAAQHREGDHKQAVFLGIERARRRSSSVVGFLSRTATWEEVLARIACRRTRTRPLPFGASRPSCVFIQQVGQEVALFTIGAENREGNP